MRHLSPWVICVLLCTAATVFGQVPFAPPSVSLSSRSAGEQKTLLPAANDCNALLAGGVFNQLRLRTASDIRLAIFDWECTTEFKTHDEAINAGLSIGFPVYGVPLQLGGTFSDTQRDTWKREHCATHSVNMSDQQQKELEVLVASKDILATYTRCIEATSYGLSLRLEEASNCDMTLFARYVPNSASDKPPKVTSFVPTGATCPNAPTKGASIPYGGLAFACRRNERDAVLISLNTTKGAKEERLAPLPDRPPRPAEPVYAEQWFDVDEAGQPYLQDCDVSSQRDLGYCNDQDQPAGTYNPVAIGFVSNLNFRSFCGVCSSPSGTEITRVDYVCHTNCGWSYHHRLGAPHNYDPDWTTIKPDTIRWFRMWQSAISETYRLHYKRLRKTCVANCDFVEQLKKWEQTTAASCGKSPIAAK
jgi:hypothetical protein